MLSFERLKELKWWVNDLRKFGVSEGNEIIALIDEAIARQYETEKVVCPNCGGSGVYQEYDEYDRYHVHACGKCDGTGEIARQSGKSEDVKEAIDQVEGTRRRRCEK